jgi:putative transposase
MGRRRGEGALMHRAQVFQLHPTKAQAEYFARAAGIARMAYNWALDEWKRQAIEWWQTGKQSPFPSNYALQRQFNAIKRERWPWITDISKLVPEHAIFAVAQAYEAYRTGQARYPRFKAKGKAKESFVVAFANQCAVAGGKLKLMKVGAVSLSRACRWPDARIIRAVVSRKAGKWYASISFDIPNVESQPRQNKAAGVDLGIKTPIKVACAGASADLGSNLIERLNVERRKLRRANRNLHRRQVGSGRRRRARAKVARLQKRIADIRTNFQHNATATIAGMAERIGVETIAVRNLLRNGRLARHIADVGFYEIRRQLAYKANALVEADRFYPSSKTCSCCGSVKEKLTLADRTFNCEDCGFMCDRDENAARNLERMAADRAVTARGDGSPARRRKLTLRSLSVKREAAEQPLSEARRLLPRAAARFLSHEAER